jgi:hypothetical protein
MEIYLMSYDGTLGNDISCILESEEQNSDVEFIVKGLEQIDVEVAFFCLRITLVGPGVPVVHGVHER